MHNVQNAGLKCQPPASCDCVTVFGGMQMPPIFLALYKSFGDRVPEVQIYTNLFTSCFSHPMASVRLQVRPIPDLVDSVIEDVKLLRKCASCFHCHTSFHIAVTLRSLIGTVRYPHMRQVAGVRPMCQNAC